MNHQTKNNMTVLKKVRVRVRGGREGRGGVGPSLIKLLPEGEGEGGNDR